MIVQVININSPNVFDEFNNKYNIFKYLREKGYFGFEIRNISDEIAAELHQYFLKNDIFSYLKKNKFVSLFVLGTFEQILEASNAIKSNIDENVGHKISSVINNYLTYNATKSGVINISHDYSLIMGILNATPDSFSDGGKYFNLDSALEHIKLMNESGADIIDVGGESTKPGSKPIAEEEELKRVIPIFDEFGKNDKYNFSIDTRKSKIAEESLKRGAKIVNDISGLTFDSGMIDVIKKYNAACVIMHMKGNPENMQENPLYTDVVSEVYDFLYKKVSLAKKSGIKNIIIDPGIGFGKTVSDNFKLLNRLDEFKGIGCPILIGVSKKSIIGKSLNLKIHEREVSTAILESISLVNGAKIIRTHNVVNADYGRKLFYFTKYPSRIKC